MHSQSQTLSDGRVRQGAVHALDSKKTMQYAWDNPSAVDKRLHLVINEQSCDIDLFQVGNLPPFKFRVGLDRNVASSQIKTRH